MGGLPIKDRLGAEGLRRLVQGERRAKVRVRHLAIADLLEGGTRGSGGAIGMCRINLAAMNQHLAEISRCVKPGADALLMIGGAGWRGDAGLVVRARMTGHYLPVPPGTQSARNKKAWFSAADRVFGRDRLEEVSHGDEKGVRGIMAFSDIANWWDSQKHESEKILTEWVQDNPQWWAVAVAGTVQTSMDLGAGLVDVLRFGEGLAEGGVKGVGKDVLRLLMLLGPLGRAGGAASRYLTPLIRSGRLRLAVQVVGVDGPCTFQAVNNAVSIAKGKNLFVTVSDMAGAVGKRLSSLTKGRTGDYELAAWIDELIPFLRQMGIRAKEVTGLTSI